MTRIVVCTLLWFASIYCLSSLALLGYFDFKSSVALQLQGNGTISLSVASAAAIGFFAGCIACKKLMNGGAK
jgi:hypothetical protein